jgi:predicted transcriptional regulator
MGRRLSKKRVKDALHQTKGAVYLAAKVLGVSHTAVYKYVNGYPDIAEIKEYYDNEMVDIAELGLMDALKKKDAWAIKYTLSTKGKHRGYVERQEFTGADKGPITFRVIYDD